MSLGEIVTELNEDVVFIWFELHLLKCSLRGMSKFLLITRLYVCLG